MPNYSVEASKLIKLAIPVLIASIAQMGMGFVDTVMAGGVSPTDMAAVAIAASIWLPAVLFGTGILIALVPVVAQLNGAGKQERIPFEIQQGIYIALLLVVPIVLVLFQAPYFLNWMDVDPLLAKKTIGYLYAIMFAAPALLLFQSIRSFTDGMSLTEPAMIIGFIGLLLNIPLNWIFVYGRFGAPALGGIGCGVATAIVYWVMFLLLGYYAMTTSRLAHVPLFQTLHQFNLRESIRIIKLGLPVAAAQFFEVTLFSVVALLVSPLGPIVVAAHQIAINFSTIVFMLPMSIGVAISIRVGHLLGEGKPDVAQVATKMALRIGLGTALITAVLTIGLSGVIATMYTKNAQVTQLAIQLLTLAGIYQCTDALQAIASGALRGYKDMKAIFLCTFISYWLIGLPTGYTLAMTDWVIAPLGARGFWIGFIVGLSMAAVMLNLRLGITFKQHRQMMPLVEADTVGLAK